MMMETNTTGRIDQLLRTKKDILNIYFTAGFPELSSTVDIIRALDSARVDMIEIGIPYSDPLADGGVIQKSGIQAIGNGMNLSLLFKQLKDLRKFTQKPVVLMGYLNTVLQFGVEKFCRLAREVGIDGVILPDLPPQQFQKEYRRYFQDHQLNFVFLVTPHTPVERIRMLDELSSGFLYAVSSASVTGSSLDQEGAKVYLQQLSGMQLSNPVLVGFGIRHAADFRFVCGHARGAIIGSAFIRMLENKGVSKHEILNFVESIRN